MAKYRIIETTYYPGTEKEHKKYNIEKRFLGILWWYNPFDDGIYSDGWFDSYDEALNMVNELIKPSSCEKIVWDK